MPSRLACLTPFLLAALLSGCGSSGSSGDDDGAGVDGGNNPGSCETSDTVCVGLEVHDCNADGTTGDLVETCDSSCSNGSCSTTCGAVGVDKVYVVTDDYRLLSFDPALLPASGSADPAFSDIGQLSCPAAASLPGWNNAGPATPFSMSVDREGNAWVLYTSGEIFLVSIANAACSNSGFAPAQMGFELFGMGFVSNAVGSDAETLFIAGGPASQDQIGNLGTVDKASKAVTSIADLPASDVGPELTGTGAAELWGYFPGGLLDSAYVGRFDQASATVNTQYPMDALPGTPRAWAFAQHGGKFYVFITYADLGGGFVPAVKVVDPATPGAVQSFATANVIVGAGVSTCAPSEPVE